MILGPDKDNSMLNPELAMFFQLKVVFLLKMAFKVLDTFKYGPLVTKLLATAGRYSASIVHQHRLTAFTAESPSACSAGRHRSQQTMSQQLLPLNEARFEKKATF